MRRFFTYALAGLILVSAPAAMAQGRGRGDQDRRQEEESAKKKARDKEWNQTEAPLPQLRNAGPCPYVKVLYDAGRYIEFDGKEAAGSVVYSGEIQGLSSGCEYKDAEPIRVSLEALFALGKGPKATSDRKTYRYWVAVTTRNSAVITKEYFDLPVKFGSDDRTMVTEKLEGIVIPRANMETSGANFEVLIGFDVTPQMAEFNRDGKRFRVSAGAPRADSN